MFYVGRLIVPTTTNNQLIDLKARDPNLVHKFFSLKTFLWYTCASRKYFISDKMQTNSSNWIENSVVRQSETRAMWVVGTVSVSHCDHNSFAGTAEYMGVIHTKSSKACCSVFFSCRDLVWPLRDVLSFAILDKEFYGVLPCFALQ